MAKRHKRPRSGLSGGDTFALYQNVLHVQEILKRMIPIPEDEAANPDDDDSQDLTPVDDMVETIRKLLEPKLNSRPVLSLSSLRQEEIEKLHLTEGPHLILVANPGRLDEERVIGENQLWSHETFYRHLCLLQSSVTQTEASARTFIDAFFYRAAAILSSRSSEGKRVVLGLEVPVNATVGKEEATLKGFVDYAILFAGDTRATSFIREPLLSKIRLHSDFVLFITEAKAVDVSLYHQLPQALGEMYACSAAVNKKIIRGALTNGRAWLFLILKVLPDGRGGEYSVSKEISIMTPGVDFTLEVNSNSCAQISVIIASWIENSFKDLDSSDWYRANV
ncbi:hypothetical protein PC9H_000175 [Pleurotus ostreatus]|uniref:Uncharacterized protein n=1 Tax=Pleurotus ostreatus TaxID=5322 RepID=A0A8H7DXK2_PLEOS|nr:uncharacterized protein PC9H_000175 [Pleurotus ostreatus]KAF7439838.1 hypothetical protein PC9H_000175 [Pleurotus ostreatus]KAJ8700986.1 hypothetical protein PTI98_003956 [Pleurotus ostreatus]